MNEPASPSTLATPRCVVVLLTFNSVGIVRETVGAALQVSPHVLAVDSHSTDGTAELLRELGCTVLQRPFSNYSEQRNWAIAQVQADYPWQLHLDADEVLDDQAVQELRAILADDGAGHDAYMLRRRDYFMGRMLRFSGVNPWHLRLFRSGRGRCEARLYDQHFITVGATGPSGKLRGFMHDKNALTLTDWIGRHNRWSDAEAREKSGPQPAGDDVLQPRLLGDARERTRFIKQLYYRLPIGMRAISYFFYRYLLRGGFLDGKPGFYFAFFQALWFRMLVDAKIYEMQAAESATTSEKPAPTAPCATTTRPNASS